MALKAVAESIFAETYGSWPPRVVALHGWGRRGRDFDEVLGGFDAVALDLPGFGASPPPPEPIGARGYAQLLMSFLDGLPSMPLLVGHSFGGRVATCLAAEGRASGLVLSGVPLLRRAPAASPAVRFRLLRWANRIGVVSDGRMEAERRRRGSEDYRAVTGVMRDILVIAVNETYEPELGRIQVPVSLVWGADDREVPIDVAERAEQLLSHTAVHFTVLDGIGHLVPTQAPARLRAEIDRRLQL